MTNIPYLLLNTRILSKEPILNKTTPKQGNSHIHKHTHTKPVSLRSIKLVSILTNRCKVITVKKSVHKPETQFRLSMNTNP